MARDLARHLAPGGIPILSGRSDGARLPSDRRFAARARTPRDGIHIPRSLHESITEMAAAWERRRARSGSVELPATSDARRS